MAAKPAASRSELTPLVLCEAEHGRQAARLGFRWLDWRRFLVEGPAAAA